MEQLDAELEDDLYMELESDCSPGTAWTFSSGLALIKTKYNQMLTEKNYN